MAYKKFDDPDTKVDQSARKVYSTFDERFRRAMQGISNRVVGSTAGTSLISKTLAGCTYAATSAGLATTYDVGVVINGKLTTCAATDDLFMPEGTQGSGSVAKYLIYTTDGTSATVGGPGNVITRSDYDTEALAAAAAKLPDLPDGGCALGYVSLVAATNSLSFSNAAGYVTGTGGTCGTGTFYDLICMPYNG